MSIKEEKALSMSNGRLNNSIIDLKEQMSDSFSKKLSGAVLDNLQHGLNGMHLLFKSVGMTTRSQLSGADKPRNKKPKKTSTQEEKANLVAVGNVQSAYRPLAALELRGMTSRAYFKKRKTGYISCSKLKVEGSPIIRKAIK